MGSRSMSLVSLDRQGNEVPVGLSQAHSWGGIAVSQHWSEDELALAFRVCSMGAREGRVRSAGSAQWSNERPPFR